MTPTTRLAVPVAAPDTAGLTARAFTRRSSRKSAAEWATGYAEGKGAHAASGEVYGSVEAYLDATGQRQNHTKTWIDGFKTGWSVASDD